MLNNSDATSTLAQSCIEKLSVFLSDKDQNLRYIALKGLSRLLQNAPHTTPLLARYYDDILTCIDEEDLTIRLKALELVERLTDRSNCKAIVVRLLEQIAPTSKSQGGRSATQSGLRSAAGALRAVSSAYDTSSPSGLASRGTSSSSPANASSFAISHYRYRLLLLILRLTSRPSDDGQQLYVNVVDFEWYVDTLFKCAYLSLSVLPTMNSPEAERLAHKLSDCLLDVTARAASVRHSSLTRCRRLLADQNFVALDNPVTVRVSSACAFILGEYGSPDTAGESTDVLVRSATFSPGNTGVCLGLLHCLARSLASMAENWEERHLATVDQVLKSICKTFEKLPCEEADLFTSIVEIVISGLAGPRETLGERGRSSEADTTTPDESAELATNPFASAQSAGMGQQQMPGESETATGPPKAMFLLQSLFAAYELRPLAPGAQALVSPPIHLDLDTPLTVDNVDLSSIADAHRPKQRLTRDSDGDVDEYGRPKVQTVSNSTSTSMAWTGIGDSDTPKKPKKSRKEGAVKGAKSRRKVVKSRKDIESDDVDSIPIVKLEMHDSEGKPGGDSVLPSSKQGERPSRIIRSQTSDTRTPSLPPIILNAGGEAPASRPVPTESTMSGSTAPGAEQFKLIQDVKEGGDASTAAQGAATVKVVKKKKRKKVKEGLLGNADV